VNKSKFSFLKLFFFPIYILFILCIICNVDNYAQSDSTHQKKWSVAVFGGASLPVSDFSKTYTISSNLGLELSYDFNTYFALFANCTYNFLKPDFPAIDFFEYGIEPYQYSASCIEATIGGKYYFSKLFPRFYSECAIGYYRIKLKGQNNIKTTNNITHDFGCNAGIGFEFFVLKDIIISLKTKFHYVITPNNDIPGTYYGLYPGIRYMF
jgi:hypothetical protein